MPIHDKKNVEESHAWAQGLMKVHSQYGEDAMMCRSMLLQSRVLFTMDEDEKRYHRLQDRIQRLRQLQASRITARHMFCKALISSAALYKQHGKATVNGYSKKLIAGHKEVWSEFPGKEREHYEELAAEYRIEKQDKINQQLQSLRVLVLAAWSRFRRRHSNGGTTLRMGLCRLSSRELSEFDELFRSELWGQQQVQQARASALKPCAPPSELEISILEAMDIYQPPSAPALPWWVKAMARGRDWLRSCVFRLQFEDRCEYFKFAHASQQPLLLSACRLEQEEVVDGYVDPATCWDEVGFDGEHAFSLSWEVVSSDGDSFQHAKAVHVLLGAEHGTGTMVHADGDWVALEDLASQPMADEKEAPLAASKSAEQAKVLKGAEPWMHHAALWDFMRDYKDIAEQVAAGDVGDIDRHGGQSSSSEDGSDDGLDVFGALADKRAELDRHGLVEEDPFLWGVRGGQWTADRHGVAFDSFRANARSGLPSRFCECQGIPKSATFSISKYEDENCILLCKLWVFRMRFLYNLWRASGSEGAVDFSKEDFTGFRIPAELECLFTCPHMAARVRGERIRDFVPKRV